MRSTLCGLTMILVLVGTTQAATLSLRVAGQEDASTVILGLSQTATIEVVLSLEAGEEFTYTGIFLDAVYDGDEATVEAFDFQPGLPVPPATYDRTVLIAGDGDFPYAEGEGITLDEYALSMQSTEDGGLEGPDEFVLDRVEVRPLEVGTVEVTFEQTPRPPQIWQSDFATLPAAAVQMPADVNGMLYLGLGDGREGGVGPLVLNIQEVAPPDGTNDARLCGLGTVGAVFLGLAALGTMWLHRRTCHIL